MVLAGAAEAALLDERPASAVHSVCAVIVVTYNSAGHIQAFLDSLEAAATGVDLEVICVDNGSTDATVSLLKARGDVKVVETRANLGYAGGINAGRSFAPTGWPVLIANPDMLLQPGAINAMLVELTDPSVGAVVPRLRGPEGSLRCSLRRFPSIARELGETVFGDHWMGRPSHLAEVVRDRSAYVRDHDIEWATGAALLVAAKCDAAVGAWDERYFLYSEEVDYARRIRQAGYRIRYCATSEAVHQEGGSGRVPDLVALMAINRVRYAERYFGRWQAVLYRVVVLGHEVSRGADRARLHAALVVARRARWAGLLRRLGRMEPWLRTGQEGCRPE